MKGRSDMLVFLASMEDALHRAIIDGQLPRKEELSDRAVYNAQGKSQPGKYLNAICDLMSHSPTPVQWTVVCKGVLEYIMVTTILLKRWTNSYTQSRFGTLNWPVWACGGTPIGARLATSTRWEQRDTVKRLRMECEPGHAPLNVPLVDLDYSHEKPSRAP